MTVRQYEGAPHREHGPLRYTLQGCQSNRVSEGWDHIKETVLNSNRATKKVRNSSFGKEVPKVFHLAF